jgi:hypothetical protein
MDTGSFFQEKAWALGILRNGDRGEDARERGEGRVHQFLYDLYQTLAVGRNGRGMTLFDVYISYDEL